MGNSKELLFTYGTLRRGMDIPMQHFIEENAVWRGKALFQGVLYLVGKHPATLPSEDESHTVLGDLYEISASAGLLDKLDRYEGYDADHPRQSLYIRKEVTVKKQKSGKSLNSWIYIFNGSIDSSIRIHSGDYLQFMKG